ncbi:hypothetical protein [Tautonia sociabilis]|uniref:Uncharacterized protein n=1 Tax=Tautonia sociabilis TaxID=2080755 RepID=A0A432MNF9_9BACT|nr:hypothetical protein [Tautonia sociabilis]RUL88608.1 hypothetical protein TsocGM_06710 [Tautonia sociabilis]
MRPDSNDSEASWAGTALAGVTVGSLLTIWSGLWMAFLLRNRPDSSFWTYLAAGMLLTGLAFLIGGFTLGIVRRQTEGEAERGLS